MTIQRPLFWHQGLFLQPQHFQLADLYYSSLLTPFMKYPQPYFWGVGELQIQKAALGNRSFDMLKGEFLFPDGSYVVFPGNSVMEARNFEESWVEGGRPLKVFVGLKKWSDAGENVTVLPALKDYSEVATRFVTTPDPEQIGDMHRGGPPAQVKRLYFLLKIFWETEKEKLGDYLTLPLGQLVRMGEQVTLSEQFVPPPLSVASFENLGKLVKEIRDEVASRARQLEEYKTRKGIHTAEFGARDMVYLLALRSLNRYVPLLHHVTEVPRVHPWLVYGALRQLIGELSSFSERFNVRGELLGGTEALPDYDHLDLWECFASAQRIIAQLLDEITAGPEYIIRLVYDGTYYAAELQPPIFEGHRRYYLVFRTEAEPELIFHSLANIAKLSCREYLPIIIARALPGIRLDHLVVPPQELPRRAHCLYFQVDHHGDQWAMVQKGRNIALYWDMAPEDLEVELMVVGRT
jgi:type VI secretion system protein ImpJ